MTPSEIVRAFKRSVNMSPAEIRAWARDPRAKCASYPSTRARLTKLAALRAKAARANAFTKDELAYMRKVVGFNARHGAQAAKHCTPRRAVALRNWGRKTCPLPKHCTAR